jgi:iron complex transport system ATP-binding protein
LSALRRHWREGLARRGIAVILSTHDPDQAFLCADRVAMLHRGRLVRLGRPAEVITRESLREIYGADVDVVPLQLNDGRQTRVCAPLFRARATPGPP